MGVLQNSRPHICDVTACNPLPIGPRPIQRDPGQNFVKFYKSQRRRCWIPRFRFPAAGTDATPPHSAHSNTTPSRPVHLAPVVDKPQQTRIAANSAAVPTAETGFPARCPARTPPPAAASRQSTAVAGNAAPSPIVPRTTSSASSMCPTRYTPKVSSNPPRYGAHAGRFFFPPPIKKPPPEHALCKSIFRRRSSL